MRKRKRDWPILVYRYGVYHPGSSTPPEIVATEALAMQEMWNELLRRDAEKTGKYREIIAEDPALAAAQAIVAERQQTLADARQALKNARQRARKRQVPDQALLEATIASARIHLAEAYTEEKRLRTAAKLGARSQIKDLQADYDQQRRQLRSTIKTVMGDSREYQLVKFDAACGAARKSGLKLHEKMGFPTQINIPHLFTMGWPVERIFHGSSEKVKFNDLRVGTAKRHRPIYTCSFLVRDQKIEFDVFYNRPLPEHALIKSVILHGEQVRRAGYQRSRKDGKTYRVNARWEWSLLITLELQPAPSVLEPSDNTCGIDVGYRTMPDGGLRVAYLHGDDGHDTELRLPSAMLDKLRHVWELQSKLDVEREAFITQLKTLACPPDLSETGRQLLSAPKLGFPGLRRLHAELLSCSNCEMQTQVEKWQIRSSRLYFEYRGLQRRLVKRRRDLYRKWAYWVCKRYGTIQIEDLDVKTLGEQEKESLGHGEVGKYRAFAAVGELLLILKQQGTKYLRAVQLKDPAMTTITCSVCGEIVTGDRAELYLQCSQGHIMDQDAQAARNLNDPQFPLAASA